jgi:hypothetical protein
VRIAILYVALGRYQLFWPAFMASCRRDFCPDAQRHWYVFTDSQAIASASDVTVLHQDFLGWPFSTLYRYHFFRRIRDQLVNFDYVVFFNANAEMQGPISVAEFFGANSFVHLVAGRHPGCHQPSGFVFPFEGRPCSAAYLEQGSDYFQGCINAGTGPAFVAMLDSLSLAIDADLSRGIVARWHDESHWNCYVLAFQRRQPSAVHVLDSHFLYPADVAWSLPRPPRILMRAKENYGGHEFLRQLPSAPPQSLIQKLKNTFS